ncbi:MAG TPA: hypothetical protein VFP60_11070 [Pseudolabrys sp.]|nr:hypothetical protein [Pseudolabrys sp.]
MRWLAVCGLLALLLTSENATGASVEEVFQQYGLFGTWATDCSRPATPGNPHVVITTPSEGLVLEDHNLGPDFAVNRYSVLSAQPIAATSLAVHVIFQPGSEMEERQKLIFSIHKNTRRTVYNQAESGAVRVKDGVALAGGSKTPTLRKCRERSVSH